MKLGVIADDFTGGTDIALTLSEGGMRVVQYVGVPAAKAKESVDAGVIALKIRTVPAVQAVAEALEACGWLLEQGCTQIVYKVCSTFDSTPAGNIGPVAEALAERLEEDVVIVCPAFPEAGRSIYQAHLFVQDRLLNESGMQDHPLTPMTDPDLRRVLGSQTAWPIAHINAPTVMAGSKAICTSLGQLARAMVIVDAIRDQDLVEIGKAGRNRKLLVGGSGIALGLSGNFGASNETFVWQGVRGAGVVLSGSCSRATRLQVDTFRSKSPSLALDADYLIEGRYTVTELRDWALAQDQPPIIYSSADPALVAAAQEKYGKTQVAAAIETLFSGLARALADAGVKRIVVAGGETSGAVVSSLQAEALQIGPKIAPGVPAVRVVGRDLALALKSGNFGSPSFFEEALGALEGQP